jgi:hypothetical protein
VLVALLVSGCGQPAPATVQPALDWARAAGFRCSGPEADQSQFLQWTCEDGSRRLVIDADANELKDIIASAPSTSGSGDLASWLSLVIGMPGLPGLDVAAARQWIAVHAQGGQVALGAYVLSLDQWSDRATLTLFRSD